MIETEATLSSLGDGRVRDTDIPKYWTAVEGLLFTMEGTGDWVELELGESGAIWVTFVPPIVLNL